MRKFFFPVIAFVVFSLGTVVNERWSPLSVFYAEWWIALAFLFWAYGFATNVKSVRVGSGAIALLTLVSFSVIWTLLSANAAYLLYLTGAFVACMLASSITAEIHFRWCASALLIVALLHSVAGIGQVLGIEMPSLIVSNPTGRVFGNISQPNHFVDLLYLGLASAAYLRSVGALRWPVFGGLSVFIALASVPSGSRAVILYLAAFFLMGMLFTLRGRIKQLDGYVDLGKALLFIAICSAVAQVLFPQLSDLLGGSGLSTAFSRADGSQADGQRLYNLRIAQISIKSHPLLGVGPDRFFQLSVEAMNVLSRNSSSRFAEHSHNLLAQLTTEFGVPLAVLVLVLGVFWVLNSGAKKYLENAWALLCVTIIGLHSMVEYPLWYAYFLLPFAFFLGVGDRNRPWLSFEVSPKAVKVVALLGLLVLAWIWRDWQVVRWVDFRLTSDEPDISLEVRDQVISELNSLSRFSVFSEYASRLRLQAWRPAHGGAAEQADQCERNWTRKPAWFQMMHCAEAYALTRREADLDTMVQAFCEGFPGKHQVFKDWARDTDAALSGSGALILSGRRCF